MAKISVPPNIVDLFDTVSNEISKIVDVIDADQWHLPTPCSLWDVSALLNHMLSEVVWVEPLLNGQTIEQVGNQFDGNLLGDDPKQAWRAAVIQTQATIADVDLKRLVHLSAGDKPAGDYLAEVFSDLVIHSWDLAKATGYDTNLKPDLVEAAWKLLSKAIPMMRSSGAYSKPVIAPKSANKQTKLLSLTGRVA